MTPSPDTPEGMVERCCRYCGGAKRFQVLSMVSDHAWATCFCARDDATTIERLTVENKVMREALERIATPMPELSRTVAATTRFEIAEEALQAVKGDG